MSWEVTFYSERVEKEILGFLAGILADLLHILEMIGRSFFAIVVNDEIVILHSFVKKSQKTPKKELDKARKRLKELQ
ncbi:type II toxin-antitoxin system RelE/ParE family toxin [Sulfurovum sp.]|uniref:type II toxin-antitoxin system RelE/ParE family toxin n=1 Tax=Sulfurovum sp. TaxID=1969726 RepID=UPI0025F169D5|nr:type II toxin-antitoxin system RelE/ParE family toxin [Sulfurovum sp.]